MRDASSVIGKAEVALRADRAIGLYGDDVPARTDAPGPAADTRQLLWYTLTGAPPGRPIRMAAETMAPENTYDTTHVDRRFPVRRDSGRRIAGK